MSNPGTSAQPWSTLEAVFTANKTFVGGDVIYLRSGYHGIPSVKGVIASGTVTIQPDTGATPKVKTLVVKSAARWVISGLDICPENLAPGTYTTGHLADIQSTASYITLKDCTIRGALDITGWTVTDWQTRMGGGNAVNVYAPYSTIANNTLQNVSFGIVIQKGGSNSLISGNTTTNFYNDGSRGLANDCIFEYNTIMNSYVSDSNHDDMFQSWSLGGTNGNTVGTGTVSRITLRNNIFIGNTDPNQPLTAPPQGMGNFDGMFADWRIENNVICSQTYHGISLYGAINCSIVNNTVVECAATGTGSIKPWILITEHKELSSGVPWPVQSSGNVIRNNISSAAASMPASAGVMDHNITTSAYSTYFKDWANYDFSLIKTAPAVDAGSTTNAPAIDIEGRARVIPYDVGAYEYLGITSPLTASGTNGSPFSYNITANTSPTSYDAANLPAGLGVDGATGLISGTPMVTGSFASTISAIGAGGTSSATLTFTIQPPAPVITSAPTATGTYGTGFTYSIWASNNPTSFGATGLPTGLSVNTATGLISGTPTVTGTFAATISATNGGGTGSATLTLTIVPMPVVITSALVATGTTNTAFSYNITASGNPTSFGATGLPTGLGVNTATGLISGTPTVTGTFSSTISATNASGGTDSETLVLTILQHQPGITSPLTAVGANGVAFSYTITANNNPTSYDATGLPAGFSVNNATGVISGTPTATGTFSPTISASNAGGSDSKTLTLIIMPAHLVYEGFDYAATNNISTAPDSPSDLGLTGTTWSGGNKVLSPGLSFTGMPNIGNALQFSSNVGSARSIDMSAMPAGYTQVDSDSVTRLGKAGTTLWFRFLMRTDVDDATHTQSAALNLNGSASGGITKMSIGVTGTSGNWSVAKGSTVGVSGTPIVTGSTVLLVVRVQFVAGSNNDQVDLFVNPPTGQNPPGTPDATLRNLDIGTFDRVEFKGTRKTTADELSMATDWSTL